MMLSYDNRGGGGGGGVFVTWLTTEPAVSLHC